MAVERAYELVDEIVNPKKEISPFTRVASPYLNYDLNILYRP